MCLCITIHVVTEAQNEKVSAFSIFKRFFEVRLNGAKKILRQDAGKGEEKASKNTKVIS